MITIVAVDDNTEHLEILMKDLGGFGHTVYAFEEPQAAYSFMESSPESIDIVILDKMMPQLDGLEIARRLSEHAILRNASVIMQTADTAEGKSIEAIEKGVHFYLTKPFRASQLTNLVKAAIRLRYQNISTIGITPKAGKASFVDRISQ